MSDVVVSAAAVMPVTVSLCAVSDVVVSAAAVMLVTVSLLCSCVISFRSSLRRSGTHSTAMWPHWQVLTGAHRLL